MVPLTTLTFDNKATKLSCLVFSAPIKTQRYRNQRYPCFNQRNQCNLYNLRYRNQRNPFNLRLNLR